MHSCTHHTGTRKDAPSTVSTHSSTVACHSSSLKKAQAVARAHIARGGDCEPAGRGDERPEPRVLTLGDTSVRVSQICAATGIERRKRACRHASALACAAAHKRHRRHACLVCGLPALQRLRKGTSRRRRKRVAKRQKKRSQVARGVEATGHRGWRK